MPITSPMFPLGSVLFPHGLLPLHVFEPRYRQMTEQCLADDSMFGVVLIERGSEVGGGDTRFDVGTLARIVQAQRFDDGRFALLAAGVQRARVVSWLLDDPYPRAELEPLDETVGDVTTTDLDEITRRLERVRALYAELGAPLSPAAVALTAADPVRATFEAASMAPIGPLDGQSLLELDDAGARAARLVELLAEVQEVLELRLANG